jgi:hypothetical protein
MKDKRTISASRTLLKVLLERSTLDQQQLFVRMYDRGDTKLSPWEVVDKMDPDKLDWAIIQCKRTSVI